MAVRLYLNNEAAAVTPTAAGSWNVTTAGASRLGGSPVGAAAIATVNIGSTTVPRTVLLRQWVSDPLPKAGTIAGNVFGVLGLIKSAAGIVATVQLHIRVITSAGAARGTLLANTNISGSTYGTTATGIALAATALSSLAVQVDDRIVVEVGYRASAATATTQNASVRYGFARPTTTTMGEDLLAGGTGGTLGPTVRPGWLQFTDTNNVIATKTSELVEAFDDNTLTDTFDDRYGTTSVAGGHGIVQADRGEVDYSGFLTLRTAKTRFSALDSSIFVDVRRVPMLNGGTDVYASFNLMSNTDGTQGGFRSLRTSDSGGDPRLPATLYMTSQSEYFDAGSTNVADDAGTVYRRIRVEESGTPTTTGPTVYYETAPEASGGVLTWTVRRTLTNAPSWWRQSDLTVLLEAHGDAGTPADQGEFGGVNVIASTGTDYTATPADVVGITDSVSVEHGYGQTPTDLVGLLDSATVTQTNERAATDVVGITDSVSAVVSLSAGVPNDTVGITDSVSTQYSFGYQSSTTHPVGITDSVAAVQSNARTATDLVGLTDSATVVQANARTPADAVGITDSVTAVRGLTAAPVDTVGITDSVTAIITDEYAGEWQYIYVPWGTEQFTIPDLTPGMPYDLQIRAMDSSGNASPWSDSEQLYGALDTVPPSTPAAPTVVSSKLALQVISTLGKASGGTYNLESDLALLEVHASSSSGFTPTTATKIGTMAADKGIMLAATPAIETFKVDATVALYVRVIAIDKTGNRSPASATASAIPGLLDSAYISELTASKISAGTVGADIIVGARIKTANAGARVELNTAGLQAFNTSGTQTVGISSADGSAFFEGTLRTGDTGTRIIVQPDVGQPVIRFYPSSGTNYAFINGIDNTSGVFLGMNSSEFGTSPNNYQHRVYLTTNSGILETFRPTLQTQRGGRVAVSTDGVAASYVYDGVYGGTLDVQDGIARIGTRNTAGTAWQSYVQAGNDGNIRFVGKFPNGSAQFNNSALVTGGFGVGSGFSGTGVGFGFTMASSMGPLYSLNGTPHFNHCVSAIDSSGFDVEWGPTIGTSTYTAKTFWYWAFRF